MFHGQLNKLGTKTYLEGKELKMDTEADRYERASGIQDPDGLSCDVSLGMLLRGDIRQVQAWLTEIEPSLNRNNLRLVYKILYPGRLRIKRIPIEDSDTERGLDDVT